MDSGWSGYLELELLERGRIKRDGDRAKLATASPRTTYVPDTTRTPMVIWSVTAGVLNTQIGSV